jgi:hypothetical protein
MHGRILDEYAYNQADSRQLHEVTDIASTAMIRVRGTGLVRIQMRTPAGQAELRLRTDAAPELFLNEQTLQFTDTTARVVDLRTKMRLLFGYWDQQLVFRLGDSVEYRFPIATRTTDNARLASLPPPYFSIAVRGPDSVLLTDWMLWRDVHYYADSDSGMWARFQPREDQFVLLGDNTSRSKDARFSPQYGIVPRDHILGIVTRVN